MSILSITLMTIWVVGIPVSYVLYRMLIETGKINKDWLGHGKVFSLTWPFGLWISLLYWISLAILDTFASLFQSIDEWISHTAKKCLTAIRKVNS